MVSVPIYPDSRLSHFLAAEQFYQLERFSFSDWATNHALPNEPLNKVNTSCIKMK